MEAFTQGGSKQVGGNKFIVKSNQGNFYKVEKTIREQLGGLMYNKGKGELITRTEYLRWKYRNNEKVKALSIQWNIT